MAQDRKRVKVYELKSNDWFDRGTGFCTGAFVDDEARISVQSEDDPSRTLLETKISRDDGYQKQQDTLIVWTEPNGTDMALSFQEAEGCGAIWDFVSEMQQRLGGMPPGGSSTFQTLKRSDSESTVADDGLSDEALEGMHAIMLPPPELDNLAEIEGMMRMANNSPMGRDALTKFVLSSEYVAKLVPLVKMAEDNEDVTSLHKLCNVMKTLILLNDTAIIETVVKDELILGVVGALEYDPDFPSHKANHRQYLSDGSKFKEVIPIEDEVIKMKIHFTYRLQYLKDVVLARILDDPTFSVLNSLIYFNQIDIIQHLQNHLDFFRKLFSLFTPANTNQQKKKDGVLFIQTTCAIAKSLQSQARAQLYQNLITCGLLNVITFALRHHDASVRVAGTDILVALIDHDSMMVRGQIFKAINEKTKPLTDTLIELLLVEVDLGVKAQMADAIKVLLDPNASGSGFDGLVGRPNTEYLVKLRSSSAASSQTDTFIQSFYDESAKKLFQPLQELQDRATMNDFSFQDVNLYTYLVEILTFFARSHSYKSKLFILNEKLPARVAQLMECPEKHLKLTALKYFRALIALHDEAYNDQIISNRLFDPILNILYDTMPRDNLLNSACLELFEFIKREHIKTLIAHLVETYRDKLEQIVYVDTFQNLIAKYEQQRHAAEHPANLDPNASYSSIDTEPASLPSGRVVNGGRWHGIKESDAEEEAYFNGEEADEGSFIAGNMMNGSGIGSESPARRLVDYPDDDDDAMDILATDAMPGVNTAHHRTMKTHGQNGDSLFGGLLKPQDSAEAPDGESQEQDKEKKQAPTPPPERIAEKRRREEDEDEDELAKLSGLASGGPQAKRRSSNASLASVRSSASAADSGDGDKGKDKENEIQGTAAQQTHFLRRKRSMKDNASNGGGAGSGSGSGPKITISLGAKSQSPDDGGGGGGNGEAKS